MRFSLLRPNLLVNHQKTPNPLVLLMSFPRPSSPSPGPIVSGPFVNPPLATAPLAPPSRKRCNLRGDLMSSSQFRSLHQNEGRRLHSFHAKVGSGRSR